MDESNVVQNFIDAFPINLYSFTTNPAVFFTTLDNIEKYVEIETLKAFPITSQNDVMLYLVSAPCSVLGQFTQLQLSTFVRLQFDCSFLVGNKILRLVCKWCLLDNIKNSEDWNMLSFESKNCLFQKNLKFFVPHLHLVDHDDISCNKLCIQSQIVWINVDHNNEIYSFPLAFDKEDLKKMIVLF